ncbi:MAG: transglutaminase domain-containing protein [Myxococcota bacterium]|nr:transglutaminase domain-containing protein [Myxococcota bacterium]
MTRVIIDEMNARPTVAVLVVLAVAGGVAIAQQGGGQQSRRKLHEDLEGPTGDRPSPLIGQSGSDKTPAAIAAGDKVLPKPSVDKPDKNTSKNEPVLGGSGFAADRQTSMTPDSNTGQDGTLHYASVFNPDVLPFKRMSSFDTVGEDYRLFVGRTALTSIAVGGTTDKTRDRFWGSVLLKLTPGVDVPLPSVAPDMRILSYEINPKIRLEFSKDGADNFFVRSDESNASGTYRLVFLCDADAGYFAPSLPPGRYTPRMIATMTPPDLKTTVPEAQKRAAAITLDRLNIDHEMELGSSFNKLVAHFRGFKEGQLPQPGSGDIYRDLCDTQLGVCRHRAFAFMVTANALGIPTRYVQNEAHAFVEVWFPDRRWQRVDLGGAALRMEVTGADNKTLHRPRAEDQFAKPAAYKNSYTQLEGDISGLTQQQLADKKKSLDQSPASGQFENTGGGNGSGGTGPDRITPDPTLPAVTQDPKKQTPRLEVTLADASAYRGDVVHIEGRVAAGGRALPDHPIDVYLSPNGKNGANAVPLGRAVSGADGMFRQDFAVPAGLTLSTYEIWLSSPEDAYFNASLSN